MSALPVATWSWVFVGACSALAMRFYYIWAYRAGDASAVEVGSFALLVWGTLIGLALFGEFPTLRFSIGALIMIGGIGLVLIEPAPQAGEVRSE
jgi:S-adenosylmethionine uptake transporter